MAEPAPTSRREQNKQETRKRILATASRLLAANGLTATTADLIAEEAGVSRATFFNYFSSKNAVVAALVSRYENEFSDMIDAVRRSDMSTGEQLGRVFSLTAARMLAAPALNKAILEESERAYAHIQQSGPRFNRMQTLIRELLADGVERREVRTDFPLELLAEMVSGVYVSVLHNWRLSNSYPFEARMRAAATFLAEAIAPASARSVMQSVRRAKR